MGRTKFRLCETGVDAVVIAVGVKAEWNHQWFLETLLTAALATALATVRAAPSA